MTRPLRFASCLLPLLASLACTSTPTTTPDETGGAGGDASGGSAGTGGVPYVACPTGTHAKTPPAPTQVGTVSGLIVDQNGMPTSGGLVQVCGRDICVNARVGDDGRLAEDVAQTLDDPACKFGDGLMWGKLAVPVGAGDSKLGTLMTPLLPDFSDGVAFAAGTSISSGGVTLALDASAHVNIDQLTYEDPSQQGFRAVALPDQAVQELGQDFVLGFALSPVETRICPSPAVSIENSSKLAAGTPLELYILGVDVLEAWAPYGGWEKVSDGQVSDDGATLEFPDGLPLLTAIGIKEKK